MRGRVAVAALVVSATLSAIAWATLAGATARHGWPPDAWMAYDFRAFHGAGQLAFHGLGDQLYDPTNPVYGDAPLYVNPPFYAVLMIPLSLLPAAQASALWLMVSIASLGVGSLLLDSRRGVWIFAIALLSAPALHAAVLGQNTMIAFLLLSLGYWALVRGHGVTSGVAIALVAAKPQLISGVVVFLGSHWRRYRRALIAIAGALSVLVAVSYVALPEAWRAYPSLLASLPDVYASGTVPFQDMGVGRALSLAFPGAPAWMVLWGGVAYALILVGGEIWFLRQEAVTGAVGYASGVLVSVAIAPHLNTYDWLLLAIPLALLWTSIPGKRSTWLVLTAVLAWTAMVAPWLVEAQLAAFGRALAPSSLILLLVIVVGAAAVLDGVDPVSFRVPVPD